MTKLDQKFALHLEPVWRSRSNYIINAKLAPEDAPKEYEQLWTRRVSELEFEVCCIPFFLYGVALGDVVRCFSDGSNLMEQVVQESGRYVFRVYFGTSDQPFGEIVRALTEAQFLLEWSSRDFVAVDAESETRAQELADYLAGLENEGRVEYETGRLHH